MNMRPKSLRNLVAASLLGFVAAGSASAVTISQEQVMTSNGQDFTFTFSGLAPSAGGGGTLVIENGPSLSNPGNYDGLDLESNSEYFEVTFEGTSLGRHNCSNGGPASFIAGCVVKDVYDSTFSLAIALTPAMILSAVTDGSVTVMINFTGNVNHFGDQDVVRSALTYEATEIVPIPMSALLLTSGLVVLGAIRMRKS